MLFEEASKSSQMNPVKIGGAAVQAQVTVEVSEPVRLEDMEILTMFFESRRQSDGGDILSIRLASDHTLQVVFSDMETKRRVLKRRFFQFNSFLLRASDSGYQSDVYAMDTRKLLISNIDVDIDEAQLLDKNKNYLVVKLYAEHLLPDNDIVDIKQSKVFPRTFLVTYTHDFEKEKLNARHAKKPMLRNQTVELYDCMRTYSLIIRTASGNGRLDAKAIKADLGNAKICFLFK